MTGNKLLVLCSRRSVSNVPALCPPSPAPFARVSVFFFAFMVFSLTSAALGVALEGPGELVEPVLQQDLLKRSESGVSSRVKRSRDVQQLCGYRLLDALRSVCDRNFVGFTRRSDPSLLMQSSEGQSGEDFGSVVPYPGGLNLSPWEILTFELPSSSADTQVGDAIPVVSATSNNLDASMLDYLELLQQQGLPNPFAWSPHAGRSAGYGGTGSSSGNKAFALKMLAEPPKTHQRFRRNIIDECCKKPCAMNQMLKYCAIAQGKRSY